MGHGHQGGKIWQDYLRELQVSVMSIDMQKVVYNIIIPLFQVHHRRDRPRGHRQIGVSEAVLCVKPR